MLRLADEEAKRVLEAARVRAELLEVQAVQKAEATRARLEADARSSQREAAELMQGHTNVARSLLAEELRLLDDEWREEANEFLPSDNRNSNSYVVT